MSEKDHKDLGNNLLSPTDSFDELLDDLKRIHHLEVVLLTAQISDLKQKIKVLEKNEK